MRKRVQIVLAVLLMAVVGAVVWRILRPQEREPVYHGKPLGYWFRQYARRSGPAPLSSRMKTGMLPAKALICPFATAHAVLVEGGLVIALTSILR